jgi:nicotinamide mononucleotide transporter
VIDLEQTATILGLAYIFLIYLKNYWGWIFGITSSLIFVKICIDNHLFVQSFLQFIYVVLGVYGFITWKNSGIQIQRLSTYQRIFYLLGSIFISVILGFVLSLTKQSSPFLDSFIGVFGVLATYLTILKWVENWMIWIVINLLSIVLFMEQELYFSSILFLCYLFVSVMGYINWQRGLSEKRD